MDQSLISGHGHRTMRLHTSKDRDNCKLCPLPKSAVFMCLQCGIYMCEYCFKLPQQISHRLHPEHPLIMEKGSSGWYICEECKFAHNYKAFYGCLCCEFRLCVECSISTMSRRLLRWEDKTLMHYYDVHKLTKCRIRGGDYYWWQCLICGLQVWGIVYACLKCGKFIHESCIDIPPTIQHPFHPLHPLKRSYYMSSKHFKKTCNVCKLEFELGNKIIIECEDCELYLHFQCADSLLRTRKLECHTHSLLYHPSLFQFGARKSMRCHICRSKVGESEAPFFRCVQCDLVFHFNCVSIPQSFNHKYHQHTLTLKDPSTKASEESYCDICEAERKSECHMYCCEECQFYGHITCVLSKDENFPQFLSSLEVRKVSKTEQVQHVDYSCTKQVELIVHNHPLSLHNGSGRQCKMCLFKINGQAYMCETCDDKFYVHIKCAELPKNFNHPLHPDHTLSLLTNYPLGIFSVYESTFLGLKHSGRFVCDICRDVSKGFNFFCQECEFIIDIKCVFSYQAGQPSIYSEGQRKAIMHLVHKHQLILANCRSNEFLQIWCKVCFKELFGLTYCCVKCDIFFHPTCLEWPSMVEQHPLHPQHVLQLTSISSYGLFIGLPKINKDICFVCKDEVTLLGYKCLHEKSSIVFHLECGTSLARLLKHKHHDHHLYYFHIRPCKGSIRSNILFCSLCRRRSEVSYFRCLECKLNFHLKCLKMPRSARHKFHLHRLTFKNSVQFGGYYCDICEEPRDFHQPAYCCEECKFVACLNCIISEENTSNVTSEEIIRSHDENINNTK